MSFFESSLRDQPWIPADILVFPCEHVSDPTLLGHFAGSTKGGVLGVGWGFGTDRRFFSNDTMYVSTSKTNNYSSRHFE